MSKKSSWAWAFVLVLLLAALSACGEKSAVELTATAMAEVTDLPVEPVAQESNRLGEWAEDSGVALVARAVEDPAVPDTRRYEPRPGTRLVAVLFELGSLSGTHHGSPQGAKLIDDRGRRHEAVYGAMAEHEEIDSVVVDMGERISGWMAFEVPDGAVPMFLEYKPTIWGRDIQLTVSLTE